MKKRLTLLLGALICVLFSCAIMAGCLHMHEPSAYNVIEAATCEKDGTQIAICKCGAELESEKIPALGHSYKNNQCERCGEKDTSSEEVASSEYFTFTLLPNGTYSIAAKNKSNLSAEIAIPSNYQGKAVSSIGSNAFFGCDGLTSVVIPDSVTSIGSYAFSYCRGLTSVVIPDSVTSIGSYAFDYCYRLTSVEIPDSITSIGSYAFEECRGLTSVVIPDSVTSIGESAFEGCRKLVEVVNKSTRITVKKGSAADGYVGYYALAVYNRGDTFTTKLSNENDYIIYTDGAEKILVGYTGTKTNLTLPSYITKINQYAFYDCDGLMSVVIGDSVTSIDTGAFSYCDGLTSVVIGDNVTSIGISAFEYCSGLTSLVIGDNVTSIGISAFNGCSGLTSVVIPDSVTSIEARAFSYCDGLTSVVIPDSVTSIGVWAFSYCDGLTSVVIPDSVTSIQPRAFLSCRGLTSVVIGDSVTSIGERAFEDCLRLTSIQFKDTSTWYRTTYSVNYDRTQTDVSNSAINATYFTSTYYNYAWLKE